MRLNLDLSQLILAASLLIFGGTAFAQLSSDDQWALEKVQKMLVSPDERNKAINETQGAGAAHQDAINAVGNDNIEELYAISSIIMADLTRRANGDAVKMQTMLSKAKSDPKSFFEGLSPAAKNAIKKLAPKVKVKSS